MKLVECVPNFSEGRRPEVIEAICAEIAAVPGVNLIGSEMDADHNRAVVTFVGGFDTAVEAAYRAIRKASELIDLREHEGAHPRMGATDVCPFIPLGETTMDEAVGCAKALGARVGEDLGIPVFLYEEAATRPERRSLPKVRRGQFEGLREKIGTDPEKEPDFGPHHIHESAGATAVGARFFLVAYNVNLASNDVELAKRIGKEIREKNGGMPGVKAMGFLLEDRDLAQVSMNLVDYRKTSPGAAFEEIRKRAAAEGVDVLETEVIGVIPQAAINASFVDVTKPAGWTGEEILESRLGGPDPLDSCGPFLEAVAGKSPTPGGGSVAALGGALGAALATMVAGLTIGRKKYAEVQDEMLAVREKGARLQAELAGLIRKDSAAYDTFMAAIRLPKETDEQKATRREAMGAAAVTAAEVPLEVMRAGLGVMELATTVVAKGNRNAASDGAVAALFARAAIRAADMNVRINLSSIGDEATRDRFAGEAGEIAARAAELESEALAATGL